jgi:hypothetical protein
MMERVTMPFELYNALTKFQRVMNDVIRDFLHKLIPVHLDDVCV